jgi:hypothetical protein
MYAEFFYLFMQYKIAVTLEESYLWPTIAVCAEGQPFKNCLGIISACNKAAADLCT